MSRSDDYVRTACAQMAEQFERQASESTRIRTAARLLVRHAETHDFCPTTESTGLPDGSLLLRMAQRMYWAGS